MLYIVVALKPEAQAFVDKYKLKKEKLAKFVVFKNKDMMLVISGLGVDNAQMATQTLINHFDITDDDIYLNIGICGACSEYEIAQLIKIDSIKYKSNEVKISSENKNILNCVDEAVSDAIYSIVDMESYGFYDAVIHSPAIKNFYILKVVSDHFEPNKVTKESTKSLIFNAIDDINSIIKKEV